MPSETTQKPVARSVITLPVPDKSADTHLALLHRVAQSPAFQKSNRLRELLLYVGERSIRNPEDHIREYEIGVNVFGRPSDFDTSQDTIVRVQASQLRKKLQQHFAEEGADESVIFEMPKGSYTLVFHHREVAPQPAAEAASVPTQHTVSRTTFAFAAAALLLAALCLSLLVQNNDLRRRAVLDPKPNVDSLWKQIFGNRRQSFLVMADVNLLLLQDTMHRQISIADYQNKNFARLAEQYIPDPVLRSTVVGWMNRSTTTVADADVARRLGLIFASNGIPFDIVLARDVAISQFVSSNNILMGSRRANPWVGIFESQLDFETGFDEEPRSAYFINKHPQTGEAAEYRVQWSHKGYCRVAFIPNTKGSSNILLISGTDVSSTQAGGEFITSESDISSLRQSLGLSPDAPMPYFEVLLETQLVNNTVSRFKIIAQRRK